MSRMWHINYSRDRRCGGGRTATRFSVAARLIADGITLSYLIAFLGTAACLAGELNIGVTDRRGHGVSEVVVTVTPSEARASKQAQTTAIMDQRALAFAPNVLVVATGTSIEFPNNDSVSHQVYSFSPAKKFQLPLYKGVRHPAVTFEHEGIVVLGCNIHDAMVGYIYVTDSPFFGKTDADGTLRLQNIKGGDYKVSLWSPFVADNSEALNRNVHVDEHDVTSTRVQLTRELRDQPEPRPRRKDWEY
jgi:plastocyanin